MNANQTPKKLPRCAVCFLAGYDSDDMIGCVEAVWKVCVVTQSSQWRRVITRQRLVNLPDLSKTMWQIH